MSEELTHRFARHAGKPPGYKGGDLSRNFNFVAWTPEQDYKKPAPTLDLEHGGGPSMNLKVQRESRGKEMRESIQAVFRRVARRDPNAPDLGNGR